MKINNHIYKGEIKVSQYWIPIVLKMIDNIDRELRIKYLPKPLSNFILRFRRKNKITKIKSSFGMLKVQGENLSIAVQNHIKLAKVQCSNTCELCGTTEDVSLNTIKGWVYTCCKECKNNG